MVSFDSPQKNLEVYKFVVAIRPLQEFFEIERSKLLQKYGTDNGNGHFTIKGKDNIENYQKDIEQLLSLNIQDVIPFPNINIDDFSNECCNYPDDKGLWMNAYDIESVLNFIKKQPKKE